MRENTYLDDNKIDNLIDILNEAKEDIMSRNATEEKYHLDKNELSDPLDEANINIQASQELRFRNRELFYLKKIDKSLKKFDSGTYGLCGDCDAEIGYERLKARPTAELCIICKEESEFSENNNFIQKKSKSLGKTLAEM
jgi:DnaK suppressor protein